MKNDPDKQMGTLKISTKKKKEGEQKKEVLNEKDFRNALMERIKKIRKVFMEENKFNKQLSDI